MLEKFNEGVEQDHRERLRRVIDTYAELFKVDEAAFAKHVKEEGYSLRPLNAVIADYLPSLSDEGLLVCLKMLKSNDIHQFSEPFLKALHNRYSDKQVIQDLMKTNGAAFLLDFADNWPFFLSN